MGRPAHPFAHRAFSKIWVLHLLHMFHAELWQLNAQLTLPPVSDRSFDFGRCPKPLLKHQVRRYFEQALRKGNDPTATSCMEPTSNGHFNLFHRVGQHVPTSEDWLFRPLMPYCRPELPTVDASAALVNRLLERLGIGRASNNATWFALRVAPRLVHRREREFLKILAEHPAPLHLELLIALYHERKWHFPLADETRLLDHTCCMALRNFLKSEVFTWSEEARSHQDEIDTAFRFILRSIRHVGHRSMPPATQPQESDSFDLCDPFPNSPDRLGILTAPSSIICASTARFHDADECAGMAYGIPLSRCFDWKPTMYSKYEVPTNEESRKALSDLMADAVTSPHQFKCASNH